jgi:hypothetical protein
VETHGGDRAPVGTLACREINIPADRRSGKSTLKTLTQKSEPSIWGDRCQKSVESRDIGHREIRVPEVKKVGTSQVSKSWRNWDRPSEEDAWQKSEPSGKGLIGGRPS